MSMEREFKQPIVSHWVKVIAKTSMGGDTIKVLRWTELPFQVRSKWDWYFKYRAALLQVEWPRAHVEFRMGSEPAKGQVLENLRSNQLRARKGKITEISNKIEKVRKNWNQLFPIEDDEFYQKAMNKLNRLKFELKQMEVDA